MAAQERNDLFDPILADLIPGYIESQKRNLEALSSALELADFKKVTEISHKIKGSAACYGFKSYGALAVDLEESSKLHEAKKCRDVLSLMQVELGKASPCE